MDFKKESLSRRKLVTHLGVGIAGAALTAAVPAAEAQTGGSTTAPFIDPTAKYPKPPYPGQSQPWPGLASKMNPRPDHGETSYKGSGRLIGRKALITGGDSGMGRAAAIAYAREGADVAISYYPTEEPDAREVIQLIKAEGRKAIPLPGDLRQESYCKELVAKAVEALGGLDIVVSNAGRQQQCEDILQLTTEAFDATMKTNIYAPFWIIKAALPHLKPGSCIIGTTSEQAYDPAENLYDYAQTKAATMNYVKSLAKQFGPERNSGQRRRTRAYLDAPSGIRRSYSGPSDSLRRKVSSSSRRSTGGTGEYLRSARGQRRQLYHWEYLRCGWRRRAALDRVMCPTARKTSA